MALRTTELQPTNLGRVFDGGVCPDGFAGPLIETIDYDIFLATASRGGGESNTFWAD